MHITLLFLGDVEEGRLSTVCEAARHVPLAAPVASLHSVIKGQMESVGLTTESRAFRPHITLARFKRRPGSVQSLLAEYGETTFGSFQVAQFVLFESKQSADGSVYKVLDRSPSIGI